MVERTIWPHMIRCRRAGPELGTAGEPTDQATYPHVRVPIL